MKIGELASQIALGMEKGIAPTELQKLDFLRSTDLLVEKLNDLKQLTKYELERTTDVKISNDLTAEIEQIDKQVIVLRKEQQNLHI